MKNGKKIAVLLAVVIGLAGAPAAARWGHGSIVCGMGPGFPGLKMVMALDLSDDQRDEIRSIIEKYRAEGQTMREQFASAREDMAAAMLADTLDEAAVRSRFQAIAPLMEEAAVLAARVISEVKPVLTAEQIQLLKEMRTGCAGRGDRSRWCPRKKAADGQP